MQGLAVLLLLTAGILHVTQSRLKWLPCPGSTSMKCPAGATCCPGKTNNTFHCCPMVEAVCCSDGVNCCPSNSYCNVSKGHCGQNLLPMVPLDDTEDGAVYVTPKKHRFKFKTRKRKPTTPYAPPIAIVTATFASPTKPPTTTMQAQVKSAPPASTKSAPSVPAKSAPGVASEGKAGASANANIAQAASIKSTPAPPAKAPPRGPPSEVNVVQSVGSGDSKALNLASPDSERKGVEKVKATKSETSDQNKPLIIPPPDSEKNVAGKVKAPKPDKSGGSKPPKEKKPDSEQKAVAKDKAKQSDKPGDSNPPTEQKTDSAKNVVNKVEATQSDKPGGKVPLILPPVDSEKKAAENVKPTESKGKPDDGKEVKPPGGLDYDDSDSFNEKLITKAKVKSPIRKVTTPVPSGDAAKNLHLADGDYPDGPHYAPDHGNGEWGPHHPDILDDSWAPHHFPPPHHGPDADHPEGPHHPKEPPHHHGGHHHGHHHRGHAMEGRHHEHHPHHHAGTGVPGSVVCPGMMYSCPIGNTCCGKMGDWRCCPFTRGVCCSSSAHCCPSTHKCITAEGCRNSIWKSETPFYKQEPALPLNGDMEETFGNRTMGECDARDNKKGGLRCPDYLHMCPMQSTCCVLKQGEWACCPFTSAVCCTDHKHCCPAHYHCDVTTKACVQRGASPIPWARKFDACKIPNAEIPKWLADRKESSLLPLSADMAIPSGGCEMDDGAIMCQDRIHLCPKESTCCLFQGNNWGCCPFKNGICCIDRQHCCPPNYRCKLFEDSCIKLERPGPVAKKTKPCKVPLL